MEIHGGRKPTFLLVMHATAQLGALEQLAGGVAATAGLELVQVEVKGQGAGRLLRVFVDQPAGVSLAECERVSRALSEALDAREAGGEELLSGPYTLEVSSPGLERPLVKRSDFERFAGQRVNLRIKEAWNGCRNFTGTLEASSEAGVKLQPEAPGAEAITIAWANLAQARLAPKWPEPKAKRRH